MRIALVDNSRGWGGAEEIVYSLAAGLRNRGHYVGLFLRAGSESVGKFAQAGFDVWTIPRSGLRMFPGILKMIRIARNGKFDLIHVHRNHDLIAGKIVGYFAGKLPLVLTQHCWLGNTSFPLINLPDRIVTVSKFIAGGITERYPALSRKISVVHNGINLADFAQPRDDYWGVSPALAGKGPLLGVVGYFYKNQEELIELLPRIKTVFPNVMLIIIGRDDKKGTLLEKKAADLGVAESVFFAGNIPHEEMKHALAGLDLNISAFRSEGFGLSVIEGMAVGTPFVGFRAGGYPDIVKNGENGYLADNREGLLQSIITALENKDTLYSIGENAMKTVSAKFSLDTMISAYEALYRTMGDARC
jgi:glycosyltransferase involved in cell wall biosynthesis